jgi:hypothetical protein
LTDNKTSSGRALADIGAVISRLETLADTPVCAACEQAMAPVAGDVIMLAAESIRLRDALYTARLESANRLAAIRAALHAASDGEPDPLAYLRDELDSTGPGSGR